MEVFMALLSLAAGGLSGIALAVLNTIYGETSGTWTRVITQMAVLFILGTACVVFTLRGLIKLITMEF